MYEGGSIEGCIGYSRGLQTWSHALGKQGGISLVCPSATRLPSETAKNTNQPWNFCALIAPCPCLIRYTITFAGKKEESQQRS
jgi:hypothetical protein